MSRFDDAVRAPYYFAYGSNMDERQMRSRVPGSELIGPGWLAKHEFVFSGYSETWGGAVANVKSSRKKGAAVAGVVWALPPGGLGLLDRYEGYPRAYQRKTARVRLVRDGTLVGCVLYFKRLAPALAPPSPAYVTQILRALKTHGFD